MAKYLVADKLSSHNLYCHVAQREWYMNPLFCMVMIEKQRWGAWIYVYSAKKTVLIKTGVPQTNFSPKVSASNKACRRQALSISNTSH